MKIVFYRTSTNASGDLYDARLMSVEIERNTPEAQAIIFAKQQFEAEMKIDHWQKLAHGYRVE